MGEAFRHPDDIEFAGLTGGLKDKRIIVQGLGNVGYHAVRCLSQEDGAKIIGVLERDGAVFNESGIDVDALHRHIEENGTVKGYDSFTSDAAKVLTNDCDILIPAAMEGVITKDNAHEIKANIIIEGANGPVTFTANRILCERGCLIIPDLYANAGGVTVSYFEWVKNIGHIRFGRMQRRQHEGQTLSWT